MFIKIHTYIGHVPTGKYYDTHTGLHAEILPMGGELRVLKKNKKKRDAAAKQPQGEHGKTMWSPMIPTVECKQKIKLQNDNVLREGRGGGGTSGMLWFGNFKGAIMTQRGAK